MSTDHLAELLLHQCGVVSRRQVLEAGLHPHDLRRMVRRRELAPLHLGVYVDHTGEPTWVQRAWAGVLVSAPAALVDESALRWADGPGRRGRDDAIVHVAVDHARTPAGAPGLRVHRVSGLTSMVLWNSSPPRMRPEHAALRVASRAVDDFGAVRVLADAVQSRRTTVPRMVAALADLPKLGRRRFLAQVLGDLSVGACSVLERGYLTRVERPHGLPTAQRQVRDSISGPVYRDVLYLAQQQVVELDGRLFHDTASSRRADLDRDLDAATQRLATVRLGWGQVFGSPCRTAERIGALLGQRGWLGQVSPCRDCR